MGVNGCVLVDRTKSLGHVLRIGRIRRAVAVSLPRVALKRTPECNGARAGVVTHLFGSPARPHLRGFSSSGRPYNAGVRATGLTRLKTSRAAYRLRHRMISRRGALRHRSAKAAPRRSVSGVSGLEPGAPRPRARLHLARASALIRCGTGTA